ncbi:MAG TPA: DUF5302 domain-containing protein [Dermatophilaceae bacterium]|nr:DUF5302 domain-containing protein [Dermatophilaceae bacterium]
MSGSKGSHQPASEQVKEKFRAALERKHAHGGADVSGPEGGSRVAEGGHGPSAGQRMFRRKSGG